MKSMPRTNFLQKLTICGIVLTVIFPMAGCEQQPEGFDIPNDIYVIPEGKLFPKRTFAETPNARDILKEAVEAGKSKGKSTFVIFKENGHSWPARFGYMLEANADIFDPLFHFVTIDTDSKMEEGRDLMREMAGGRGGNPFSVILDGEGNELASSRDAEGRNIGCPASPKHIEHFLEMIKASTKATEEDLKNIEAKILPFAKKWGPHNFFEMDEKEDDKKQGDDEKPESEESEPSDQGSNRPAADEGNSSEGNSSEDTSSEDTSSESESQDSDSSSEDQ